MRPYSGRWTFHIDEEADLARAASGKLPKSGERPEFIVHFIPGLSVGQYVDGLNGDSIPVLVRYNEIEGVRTDPKVLAVVQKSEYPIGGQRHDLRGPIPPEHRNLIAQAIRGGYDFTLPFLEVRGTFGIDHEGESEGAEGLRGEEAVGTSFYNEHQIDGRKILVRGRCVSDGLIGPEVVGLIVEGPSTANERTVYKLEPVPERLVVPVTELVKPAYRTRVRFSEAKSFTFPREPEEQAVEAWEGEGGRPSS